MVGFICNLCYHNSPNFYPPRWIFLRLRITQKALQLPLFSSFFFSLQQIWTDWRQLFVKFSTYVKLAECGLIQTHWRKLCKKYLLQYEISCVKTLHTMCFGENNNGRSKRAYKRACECYQCFHDVNSIL